MKPIKKISIVTSTSLSRISEDIFSRTKKLVEGEKVKIEHVGSLNSVKKHTIKKKISKSDLILVIGGDGTMIGSIRNLYEFSIPFLGVNIGRVGFLTDIDPKNLSMLSSVLKGGYTTEKRPIYQAFSSERKEDIFINEVVIHSGSITKMIDIELSSSAKSFYRLKADGIILSSSTGSTAYSYSGGGPIIHPEVNALSLLPMFSHSSSSHSLVLPDKDKYKVKIINHTNLNPNIVLDGSSNLKYNKRGVEISNTKKPFYLCHPKDYNYIEACRTKLGWALPIENFKI